MQKIRDIPRTTYQNKQGTHHHGHAETNQTKTTTANAQVRTSHLRAVEPRKNVPIVPRAEESSTLKAISGRHRGGEQFFTF